MRRYPWLPLKTNKGTGVLSRESIQVYNKQDMCDLIFICLCLEVVYTIASTGNEISNYVTKITLYYYDTLLSISLIELEKRTA